MTKFIGIISAKGGVGKTTSAINIASALDWFKREVIVIDGNFSNPNIGVHLGISRFDKTVHGALKGRHSLKHAVYRHHTGLKLIPGDVSFDESISVQRGNLSEIINDIRGYAEAVIIDSTAGIGGDSRAVISASDYIIIVTSPDLISVGDTLRTKKLVNRLGKKVFGIIVNRVEGMDYEMDPRNIEIFLGEKIIGIIPEDKNVGHSLKYRSPVVYSAPSSPASVAFKKTAAILIGQKYEHNTKREKERSIFYYILRNMRLVR
jgi:septum site-determining protein MinD